MDKTTQKTPEVSSDGAVVSSGPPISMKGRDWLRWASWLVLAVVIVGGFLYWRHREHTVFIRSGDVTVTRSKYDAMKHLAAKDDHLNTKTQYTQRYVAIVKTQAVADSLHITPSSDEINEAANARYGHNTKLDAWQQLNAKSDAMPLAASRLSLSGGIAGAIFEFPFSSLLTSNADPLPHENDPVYIAQDRDYATSKADSFYAQLKGGKLSTDQAIQQIKADKRLNSDYAKNMSITFSASSTAWQSDGFYSQILANMQQSAKTGWSQVEVGEVVTGTDANGKPKQAQGYLYFYNLTAFSKARLGLNSEFDSTLQNQSAKVSVPGVEL